MGVSSSSVSDVTSFADVSGEEGASGKTSLLPSFSLRLILSVRFLGVCGFECEEDAFDAAETDAADMWLLTDATDGRAYIAGVVICGIVEVCSSLVIGGVGSWICPCTWIGVIICQACWSCTGVVGTIWDGTGPVAYVSEYIVLG